MKARLALANFKLEHGYSNIDLRTLESSLYKDKFKPAPPKPQDKRKRKLITANHRFYPTSPPLQHNDMDRLIKKNASRSPSNVPLSEMRSNRKLSLTLSSDDEDAAHLLVLMHQSPTMSWFFSPSFCKLFILLKKHNLNLFIFLLCVLSKKDVLVNDEGTYVLISRLEIHARCSRNTPLTRVSRQVGTLTPFFQRR
jgi:hypothetical protein